MPRARLATQEVCEAGRHPKLTPMEEGEAVAVAVEEEDVVDVSEEAAGEAVDMVENHMVDVAVEARAAPGQGGGVRFLE